MWENGSEMTLTMSPCGRKGLWVGGEGVRASAFPPSQSALYRNSGALCCHATVRRNAMNRNVICRFLFCDIRAFRAKCDLLKTL